MNNMFNKYKVLIIDDEQDIVDILDTILKREGFSNIYQEEVMFNYYPKKMISELK